MNHSRWQFAQRSLTFPSRETGSTVQSFLDRCAGPFPRCPSAEHFAHILVFAQSAEVLIDRDAFCAPPIPWIHPNENQTALNIHPMNATVPFTLYLCATYLSQSRSGVVENATKCNPP